MEENKELIIPMIFDDDEENKPKQPLHLEKGMDFDVRTKSVEEKIFITLYKLTENEDEAFNQIFSITMGRIDTYNDIKNKLISGLDIDIHKSLVITETKQTETETGDRKYYLIPLDECMTVYAFCTMMMEYMSDDEFNIEEYNTTLMDNDSESSELHESGQASSLIPRRYTAEELEYRKLLEESIRRDKFMASLRREEDEKNKINNI